jgi:hypothetical protein
MFEKIRECPLCHQPGARAMRRSPDGDALIDCPACGQFNGVVFPALEMELVQKG